MQTKLLGGYLRGRQCNNQLLIRRSAHSSDTLTGETNETVRQLFIDFKNTCKTEETYCTTFSLIDILPHNYTASQTGRVRHEFHLRKIPHIGKL